ncbi:MAG: hypothetical protein M3070_05525 [Actinomycetota bacterium]|nr:hypothetical protein [Actinomycetota bacterium]
MSAEITPDAPYAAGHTSQIPAYAEVLTYVQHFQHRVLTDAIAEASGDYWRRRGDVFESCQPRLGDWPGRATPEQLAQANLRCAATALACRQRAAVSLLTKVGGPS